MSWDCSWCGGDRSDDHSNCTLEKLSDRRNDLIEELIVEVRELRYSINRIPMPTET